MAANARPRAYARAIRRSPAIWAEQGGTLSGGGCFLPRLPTVRSAPLRSPKGV